MSQLDVQSLPLPLPRRRGRPVGSDSAETRNQILRAARQVIIERGYHAATFQAISVAAGLSRPTLHYYFASREEIYGTLVADAASVMADCVAQARRSDTLLGQLSALVSAMHEADIRDRNQIAFLVSGLLEATRNPDLQADASAVLRDFLVSALTDATARGELSADSAVEPIADMLHALLWGVGFHAGFVGDGDMRLITKQLGRVLSHGLLSGVPRHAEPVD